MLYLTCTIISGVDLAHYGVSRAKDWVSVDFGRIAYIMDHPLFDIKTRQNTFSQTWLS